MGFVKQSHKQHIRELSRGLRHLVAPGTNDWIGMSKPVILDVEDQSWAEEAAMVAEVNRRRYLNTFGDESITKQLMARFERGETAVVIADHDSPLCEAKNAHVIRLDHMSVARAADDRPGGESCETVEPSNASGADFAIAGALELTRLLRVGEVPCVAVSGSVGGAGVSTLAFFLADAFGAAGHDSLMLDAAPGSTGVDVALGVERAEGTRMVDMPHDPELRRLPQVGYAQLLTQSRNEYVPIDLPTCLRAVEESAVIVDCGRTDPNEAMRWQEYIPDAHVVVCPLTVAGVAAALINRERTLDNGWPEPLFVLRQVPHSSATLALVSVILDTVPTVVMEDHPQLALDIDSGQLEHYVNCYRESPEIVAERAAQIPGAEPQSLRASLRKARTFTEHALEYAERNAERYIERGLGQHHRALEQRVKRCLPHHAAVEVMRSIQSQRASTFLDIEDLRLDTHEKVA